MGKRYYREQIKAFEHQLGIAKETGLPVIIHSRDSLEVIFEVLKKHPYTRGILHCFPGNAAEARQAIDMGYLLGIGGVVTFKKSQMADTLREIGPANIVLETDSPYLTPVPFRGKRNESSYIPLIAQKIAELTGLENKKIEGITDTKCILICLICSAKTCEGSSINFDTTMTKSVLIIYTGGTIGMVNDPATGALCPFDFEQIAESSS